MKWHRQMCKNGNLYVLMKDKAIVGGAIMFEDEKDADIVYVGRIFVDALQYRKGYGKEIMQQIEEGIVAHSLIQSNEEIFFLYDYREHTKSPIITTGNELQGQQLVDFSKKLDLDQLYQYIEQVHKSTNDLLKNLIFRDMKRKFYEKDKNRLRNLEVVNPDERAYWLIDYWCEKDVRGLVQMPFSGHFYLMSLK